MPVCDVVSATRHPINYIPQVLAMANLVKRNRREALYCYNLYDFKNINMQTGAVLKLRDPLSLDGFVPSDLDRPIMGKAYSMGDVTSTVMTQISRYSKLKRTYADPKWVALRGQLADHFSSRFFKRKPRLVSNQDIANGMKPVIEKMFQNGGAFKELDITLAPMDETFSIHFFLKEFVKVVMAKSNDADKCGQGISAWSKTLNAVFCPMMRAIELEFKRCLKDNIIYENGLSEHDFDGIVAERFSSSGCMFVNDFKQFDENQNADTQFLEDIILDLFIPQKFVRLYREMRLAAKQKSIALSLINYGCKNSGESATLFTNTLVNMFYVCLTTKVSGVALEGYKGDDSFINADSVILYNHVEGLDPDVHLPMTSDIDFPLFTDFVSFFLSEYGIVPDIFKVLLKALAKDFDRPNVDLYAEELRASIRDKTKFLTFEKLVYLRHVYKILYGLDQQQFDMILRCWQYMEFDFSPGEEKIGFAALYDSENFRLTDDLTEAEKNAKRVRQTLGDTNISI